MLKFKLQFLMKRVT